MNEEEKKCIVCHESFPIHSDFQSTRYGIAKTCKICRDKDKKRRNEKLLEMTNEIEKQCKLCRKIDKKQ